MVQVRIEIVHRELDMMPDCETSSYRVAGDGGSDDYESR